YNWGATLFGLARRLRASASGAEADEAALQGAEVFVRALDAAGGQAVIPYTAALPLLESSIRSANPEMARRALRLAARAAEVAPAPADFFTLAVAHALAGEADQSRRLLADLARRDERSEWLDPLLADPLVGEDLKRYAAELAASVPQKKHRAASKRPSKR
ncbi:MAG: hypothetical protein HW416_3383, partial [Chloroflexi bacterium]|nr:hypothetical protein [Chloroflexota bacterium]